MFKFGTEKDHLETIFKKGNLMSKILARRSFRKDHLRKSHDKKSTSVKTHGIWQEKYITSRSMTKLRSILLWNIDIDACLQKHKRTYVFCMTRELQNTCYLTSDELNTLRRSRSPTTIVILHGEIQSNEESQLYVHDLDLFAIVQLVD